MDINTIALVATTLIVGAFAFVIYRIEKTDRDKSAANLVLEEIRAIETNVEKLKESGDLLSILPANLSTSGWFSYRHALVKHLDFDEISQIGLFFERIEGLKDLLNQWRNLYFSAMQEKSAVVQQHLATFAINGKDYEKEKKKLNIFENDDYWFEPYLYKSQITSKLNLYSSISTTTIGEKLKRVGKTKWYRS